MSADAAQSPSAEAVAFMKQSFRHPEMDAMIEADADLAKLYTDLRSGIVRNVKTQPGGFKATSGVVLPYYLNLSTNFMDPSVAHKIVALVTRMLIKLHPTIATTPDERIAVVGMEVAGGMLVSQLACAVHPELSTMYDFCYMRKTKKTTGTAQQLEGLKMFTERTPQSPPLKTVWVDDVNSTGSSLTAGIETLLADYNMDVVAAVYVVDRSQDREALPAEKHFLAQPRFVEGRTRIVTLMDLKEIDPLVPRI
jgi:orotate phosphoribosyltransferase